jgi:hypothetical protein
MAGGRLTDRVSEINLFDVRDVRAQLAGDDSQIEVRVGAQDLGARLKTALEELDRYKQTPRGDRLLTSTIKAIACSGIQFRRQVAS